MFVVRATWIVKPGCLNELIELGLKYKSWYIKRNIPVRYYTPIYGPRNMVVIEYEYESAAAAEKFDKEYISSPEYAALAPKWIELTEVGGADEGWIVNKI